MIATAARAQPAPRGTRSTGRPYSFLALGAALLAASVALASLHGTGAEAQSRPLFWWALLVVGFTIAKAYPVSFHLSDNCHNFTLTEIPLVFGLLFFSPRATVAAAVVGTVIARSTLRRQAAKWVFFNSSLLALECASAFAFLALVSNGARVDGAIAWVLILIGTALASVASSIALELGFRRLGNKTPWGTRLQLTASGIVTAVVSGSIGLVAALGVSVNWMALLPLALITLVFFFGQQGYTILQQRYQGLTHFREFADDLSTASPDEQISARIMDQVLKTFSAGRVELVVTDGTDDQEASGWLEKSKEPAELLEKMRHRSFSSHKTRNTKPSTSTLDMGDESDDPSDDARPWPMATAPIVRLVSKTLDGDEGAAVLESGPSFEQYEPVLRLAEPVAPTVERGSGVALPKARRFGQKQTFFDHLIVPLVQGEHVIGAVGIFDRRGDWGAFSDGDLALLTAMSRHLAFALENAGLMHRLRGEIARREWESKHDSLTGLPNRQMFNEMADAAINAHLPDGRVSIFIMDLNRFKDINDSLGHHVGDDLLVNVAERMIAERPKDVEFARLGGDEFAFIFNGAESADDAVEKAEEVREMLLRPFSVGDLEVVVDGAIGVAVAPDHGDDRSSLMKRADIAMYTAKDQRTTTVQLYRPGQERSSSRQLALVADLRRAIDAGGLEVHYQPKADTTTGEIIGVEALSRWTHPQLGVIAPDEFIPLAEHSGVISKLTKYVLRRSVEQQQVWRRQGIDLDISVNLSARSVRDPGLPAMITQVVTEAGGQTSDLILEITESEFMVDVLSASRLLTQLRFMGARVSIDDFGTGYSSLGYLVGLPIDELKIDKSFLADVMEDEARGAVLKAIVDLGANLGLTVVVEGVENEEICRKVAELGCPYAQGYYLTRPMAPTQLTPWLIEHEATRRTKSGAKQRSRVRRTTPLRDRLTGPGNALAAGA